MTFMRRPRVFISYRHEERQGVPGRESYNTRHRAWVKDFANALASWNVDVIWDDRLQQLFKPHSSVDPSMLPFLAEVTTLCLQVTQTFMPILTRGYLERITAQPGGEDYGIVTEEWRRGIAQCRAGRAELVTIVREWPISKYPQAPTLLSGDNAWDFRFVAPTRDEVELIGEQLHGLWEVERPEFDMSFRDWISKYLQFCVDVFDLPWPGIEQWNCDLDRPGVFIAYQAGLMADSPVSSDAGSQRDLREDAERMQYRVVAADQNVPPEPPDVTRQMEEKAKDLMRSVMRAHLAGRRKPFDFYDDAASDLPSNGMYFGPTLPSFSYLYDPETRD
jgi:hypothetical protein